MSRYIPHIHLAADDIGNQHGAVFLQQFDLAASVVEGSVNVGGLLVQIFGDGFLFGEGVVASYCQ